MSRWEARLLAILVATSLATPIHAASALNSEAAVVLESLAVKGRAPKTGYTRAQFGEAWTDVDRNGCDTRNDILKRDLANIVFKAGEEGCVVLSGVLKDPYSGTTIDFARGVKTSLEVQIDHVVALSDSWQKGSFKFSPEKRLAFANDPLNLLAVKGSLNSQKGDGDAATWLPPLKSYRCKYVARQIAVKAKYGIWITAAEKTVMKNILAKCPRELIPLQ